MKPIDLICFTFALAVFGCSDGTHQDYASVAKRSEKYFEEDKKKNSKDFVFPDSVTNRPVIARYFEEDSGAHSVIYYTDTGMKTGIVVRYFPDKSVLTDKIKCMGANEFVSVLRPEIRYVVDPDRVFHNCWRGDNKGFQFSFDHLRTDMHRR